MKESAVQIDDRESRGGLVENRARLGLALLKRQLRCPSLVNVLGGAVPQNDAPILPTGHGARAHPPVFAFSEADAVLNVVRLARLDGVSPSRNYSGQVVRVGNPHPALTEGLFARQAGEGEPSVGKARNVAGGVRRPGEKRTRFRPEDEVIERLPQPLLDDVVVQL
jgi:hypothetical protein